MADDVQETPERRGVLASLLIAVFAAAAVGMLAAAARVDADCYWRSFLLEVGGGTLVFVALQISARRHPSRDLVGLLALTAAVLLLVAALTDSDYWRSLLITLGVGVLLFLALDLLLVRILIVKAIRAQRRIVELADAPAVAISRVAEQQELERLEQLIEEYGGENPFNPFAGLGATDDWVVPDDSAPAPPERAAQPSDAQADAEEPPPPQR